MTEKEIINKIKSIASGNIIRKSDSNENVLKKQNIDGFTFSIKNAIEKNTIMHTDDYESKREYLKGLYNELAINPLYLEAYIITLRRYYFDSIKWLDDMEIGLSVDLYSILKKAYLNSLFKYEIEKKPYYFGYDIFDIAFVILYTEKRTYSIMQSEMPHISRDITFDYLIGFSNTNEKMKKHDFFDFDKTVLNIYLKNEFCKNALSSFCLYNEVIAKVSKQEVLEYPIQEALFKDRKFISRINRFCVNIFKHFPKDCLNDLSFINSAIMGENHKDIVAVLKDLNLINEDELLKLYMSIDNLYFELKFYKHLKKEDREKEDVIARAVAIKDNEHDEC